MKAMDADSPLGVPVLKALCKEMCVKDPLIKITYENCQMSEFGFRFAVVAPEPPALVRIGALETVRAINHTA